MTVLHLILINNIVLIIILTSILNFIVIFNFGDAFVINCDTVNVFIFKFA